MADVRGFSTKHLRVRVVYANIYTWRGMSLGAVHWMGELQARGGDSIELERPLSAAEAETLSKKDGIEGYYKAGSLTTRFLSHNAVQREAERRWLQYYPLAVVLIACRAACADPRPVLIGPPALMDKLNKLADAAEKIGYWDRDKQAMQKIAGEWDNIMNEIEKGQTG